MKIATWNVERLKHIKEKDKLLSEIEKIRADILVLTETDERLHPNYPYCYSTPLLKEIRPDYYKETENRVSIYSKYECVKEYHTYDKYTAICIEFETEYGRLAVYGTIIGIFGNREKTFKDDLIKQMEDIRRLSEEGVRLCVTGDYNLTFSDNYYYTKFGRETVLKCFKESRINVMTAHRKECIDHIAIQDDYLYYGKLKPSPDNRSWKQSELVVSNVDEWNMDRTLSDHKGTVIEIQPMGPELEEVDQDVYFEGTGFERYEFGDICHKGPDGFFYRVEHLPGFYVMEDAENEVLARKGIFEDTDTFTDNIPLGERIYWVHEWLKKVSIPK